MSYSESRQPRKEQKKRKASRDPANPSPEHSSANPSSSSTPKTPTPRTITETGSTLSLAMATDSIVSMVRPRHTTLVFTGKDVTEFLEDYDRQADNGGLSSQMRVSVLPDYISDEDRSLSRIIKRLAGYQEKDWSKLKSSMKDYWADEDTAVKMGKRSYLQAFIQKCVRDPPSLTEYYTHFATTSDACVASKQVPREELGILFFRGLPKHDKESVMFMMPDAPKGDDWTEYDVDKIYCFLKAHHKKTNSIDEMHT
ncbi:hypothetical protein BKA58DRAFT_74419 [Alternaria rosae]|uniref:uncharacterized protein n=1 Tax=Alternaria rosae TaxID=1187941 RepID=UPI001E8D4A2B|nr:uncharacterized protein BKA58DRAFT_74419 [Alternaria rosae]KAH6877447.1 hypothetical protein BKA58DRAFT_74419 [Alternaria rosae]